MTRLESTRGWVGPVSILLIAVASALMSMPARADVPAVVPDDPPDVGARGAEQLGVGYKVGDGLGNIGVDVEVAIVSHLALDLQASWLYKKLGASGFGIAPALRGVLFTGGGSPYLSVGYMRYRLTFDDGVKAWNNGVFANLGYQWKWKTGLAALVGGGLLYAGNVSTSDNGRTMVLGENGFKPNLELGLRYFFL